MDKELKLLIASMCVLLLACFLTGVIAYKIFFTEEDFYCIHLAEKSVFNDMKNVSDEDIKCFHSAKEVIAYKEKKQYEKMLKDNEAIDEMFKSQVQIPTLHFPLNH